MKELYVKVRCVQCCIWKSCARQNCVWQCPCVKELYVKQLCVTKLCGNVVRGGKEEEEEGGSRVQGGKTRTAHNAAGNETGILRHLKKIKRLDSDLEGCTEKAITQKSEAVCKRDSRTWTHHDSASVGNGTSTDQTQRPWSFGSFPFPLHHVLPQSPGQIAQRGCRRAQKAPSATKPPLVELKPAMAEEVVEQVWMRETWKQNKHHKLDAFAHETLVHKLAGQLGKPKPNAARGKQRNRVHAIALCEVMHAYLVEEWKNRLHHTVLCAQQEEESHPECLRAASPQSNDAQSEPLPCKTGQESSVQKEIGWEAKTKWWRCSPCKHEAVKSLQHQRPFRASGIAQDGRSANKQQQKPCTIQPFQPRFQVAATRGTLRFTVHSTKRAKTNPSTPRSSCTSHGFITSPLAKQQGPAKKQQGCIRQDPGRLLPGTQQRGKKEAVELMDLARRNELIGFLGPATCKLWFHLIHMDIIEEYHLFEPKNVTCSGQVAEQAAKPRGCQYQNTLEVMLSRILRPFQTISM